jgi:hypothetical protein
MRTRGESHVLIADRDMTEFASLMLSMEKVRVGEDIPQASQFICLTWDALDIWRTGTLEYNLPLDYVSGLPFLLNAFRYICVFRLFIFELSTASPFSFHPCSCFLNVLFKVDPIRSHCAEFVGTRNGNGKEGYRGCRLIKW